MDISDQFSLEHLLFKERECRSCHKTKDLLDDFYLIRKQKKGNPSAYSYECKVCTIQRVVNKKKRVKEEIYPDWEFMHWFPR